MRSDVFRIQIERSRGIIQREGIKSFINKFTIYLLKLIFTYGNYYVCEIKLENVKDMKFPPRIENVNLKIVRKIDHIEELVENNFVFNDFYSINNFKMMISKGSIAFCAFIGKELAHVTWVALNEKGKQDIDMLPYKVNFMNKEVCSGSSKTNPKYLNKGIYSYVLSEIFSFLINEGFEVDRLSMGKKNIPSQNALAKFNPRIYAEGRYMRIVGIELWREKPMRGG